MRLTTVQREVLRLLVKWEDHYPGIEQDDDTYGWLIPGPMRWVTWRTIAALERKGLIMPGPLRPSLHRYPYPEHYITTIEGERVGERLLATAVDERFPGEDLDMKEFDMDWQIGWERDKYEVGRVMHEGWRRQKIANGFADHPLNKTIVERRHPDPAGGVAWYEEVATCADCQLHPSRHHPDMIDWDDLSPQQQAINFEGGREAYRLGYEAALQDSPRRDCVLYSCRDDT